MEWSELLAFYFTVILKHSSSKTSKHCQSLQCSAPKWNEDPSHAPCKVYLYGLSGHYSLFQGKLTCYLLACSDFSLFSIFFCKYSMQRKAEQMFNLCHVKSFEAYFLSIRYFCRNLEFLQGVCSTKWNTFYNMDISDSTTGSKLEKSWFESHRDVWHWWLNFQVLYNYLKNSFNYFRGKMAVTT